MAAMITDPSPTSDARWQCYSRGYNIAKTYRFNVFYVRHKVKFKPFARAREGKAVYCQNENKHEKRAHHNLAYSFKPLLHAYAANKYSGNNRYSHPKAHFAGACQHIGENLAGVLISRA